MGGRKIRESCPLQNRFLVVAGEVFLWMELVLNVRVHAREKVMGEGQELW